MSLIRCNECNQIVDTDFDAEHFDEDDNCVECVEEINQE